MNLIKRLTLTGAALLTITGCYQTKTEYEVNELSEKAIVSDKKEVGIGRGPGKIYSIKFKSGKVEIRSEDKSLYDKFNEGDSVTIFYRREIQTKSEYYFGGHVKTSLFPDTTLILLDVQK